MTKIRGNFPIDHLVHQNVEIVTHFTINVWFRLMDNSYSKHDPCKIRTIVSQPFQNFSATSNYPYLYTMILRIENYRHIVSHCHWFCKNTLKIIWTIVLPTSNFYVTPPDAAIFTYNADLPPESLTFQSLTNRASLDVPVGVDVQMLPYYKSQNVIIRTLEDAFANISC